MRTTPFWNNLHRVHSVRNYLSGIKTWTVLLKFDVEEFYSPTLKMTLSGVEKLNTYIPKIRLPLEPAQLYSIYKVLDLSSIQNTVFWALLLIGFYGMLRNRNLPIIQGILLIRRNNWQEEIFNSHMKDW